MVIEPLAEIPMTPMIASLPKADLHLHQEERARLDRVLARRQGRSPYDWRRWARHLMAEVPPGMARLGDMYTPDADLPLDGIPAEEPEYVIAKIADALMEGAADGALLVEVRFGTAEQRADAVHAIVPSRQRQYRELVCRNDSMRLYLPGRGYSVGLIFDENGGFMSWYGNLEAPFVRTALGIDTRDFALDVVATPDGRWRWKDEEEFARRLEVGIDSAAHQARVRAAGRDFIARFERSAWPFNAGWETWRPPAHWQSRSLPEKWAVDLGTHELLSTAVW